VEARQTAIKMNISIDVYFRLICCLFNRDEHGFLTLGEYDKLVQIFMMGITYLSIIRLLLYHVV
jgi:hypothetical protein